MLFSKINFKLKKIISKFLYLPKLYNFSNASELSKSSLSKNKINSPFAFFNPKFLALFTPLFF